jgi:hypothetical protein
MKFSWVQIKSKQSKLLCVPLDAVNKPGRINSEKKFSNIFDGRGLIFYVWLARIQPNVSRRCVFASLSLCSLLSRTHSVARSHKSSNWQKHSLAFTAAASVKKNCSNSSGGSFLSRRLTITQRRKNFFHFPTRSVSLCECAKLYCVISSECV